LGQFAAKRRTNKASNNWMRFEIYVKQLATEKLMGLTLDKIFDLNLPSCLHKIRDVAKKTGMILISSSGCAI
jgi:hypothetical protein